jgi:BASS family bile acid:Na+ symporter
LLALALIHGLGLTPGWAMGLLILAAVPGGATSNLFTYLAKGNVPLSIAVTLTSTLLCVATIPLLLHVFAGSFLAAEIEIPSAQIAIDIGRYLLGPVAAGMLVYRYAPRAAPHVARWGVRGSLLLVLTVAIAATGSGRIQIGEYGWGPPLTIIAFGVTLLLVVPHALRLLRRPEPDIAALSIEVVIRNTGIALLLVPFFFQGQPEQGHLLFSCLLYSGLSGALMLPILLLHRAGRSAAFLLPRPPPSGPLRPGAPDLTPRPRSSSLPRL